MKPTEPVLQMQDDAIVQFVRENYTRKIVEIGVGQRLNVAERMKETMPTIEVLVTDTQESLIRGYDGTRVKAIVDNVFSPSVQVYQGASLIYSLNPPVEMIPALEGLAKEIGADLFVRLMSDEQDFFYGNNKWHRILRQGLWIGWLLAFKGHETV
ncbi:MAG TPA: UPF0146 family protein [Candidatus Binatus sp.]|nr:UPF0146 family protein [Candidatus Binatus sp.]